jgi:transketolase
MLKGFTRAMGESEAVETRLSKQAPFAEALIKMAEQNERIVALTADLGKYTDLYPFRDRFPERYFNIGMAEQAMVTAAVGLSKTGFVPFCTTFGAFAVRRALDFIMIAGAHSNENVKLFCALPGLTTGYGATHQATEDLAVMGAVPDLMVVDPGDAIELQSVVRYAASTRGSCYVRLPRGIVPVLFDEDYTFEPGRAKLLRDGDVALISTGLMTERALDAAAALQAKGISAAVLHCPSIKPFDQGAVAALAKRATRVVTLENHSIRGGLGSLVAETLYERGIVRPMLKIGLPDAFLGCGSVPFLQDQHGLTTARVVEAVSAFLKRDAAPQRLTA